MHIHKCFRREAGSYGKDVRGLNRLHEFSKVELVRIDKPEHSKQSHQEMLDHVEGLLQKLELPYRILRLCGGDMSFTAALCFDFEVYSEAQKTLVGSKFRFQLRHLSGQPSEMPLS